MKACKCGCGSIATCSNGYVKGHWNRGIVPLPKSLETRLKLSKANFGHSVSEETRRKIGNANKGHVCSKEHKKAISNASKGRIREQPSDATKRKISIANKGHVCSEGCRRKISIAMKGKPSHNKGKSWEQIYGIEKAKMLRKDRSTNNPMKRADVKARALKASMKTRLACPSPFEKLALVLVQKKVNLPFTYCGDGSFLAGSRNPDAISEDKKVVALFHGVYWHLKKNGLTITEANKRIVEKQDSKVFVEAGYKVVFIWEDEVYPGRG